MLAPQLLGRLLTEVTTNEHIRNLLKQCDNEGPAHNALLPTYHCMHTPGGPLKYVSTLTIIVVWREYLDAHNKRLVNFFCLDINIF